MAAQNQFATMSAAATIAPIVLWSNRCQSKTYLAGKNTFLEFYTDEDKAIKRSACARSASADSHFKSSDKFLSNRSTQSTATSSRISPTNRSSSPSTRSMLSSENDVVKNSKERVSRQNTPTYRWGDLDEAEILAEDLTEDVEATLDLKASLGLINGNAFNGNPVNQDAFNGGTFNDDADAFNGDWMPDFECDHQASNGYPVSPMMFMMPPMMMPQMPSPCFNQNNQNMMPQFERPLRRTKFDMTNNAIKSTKKQDLKKLGKFNRAQEITTLMVRGIPCSFSQEALLQLIDEAGLQGKYNFFYLPRDGKRSSNLGYAFINFVDQDSAEIMTSTFTGVPLAPARSKKVCTVSPADIQGLTGLSKHFRCTAVSRGTCGPVFFKCS